MSKRTSGPRIAPTEGGANGPRGSRTGGPQPQTPPTIVQIGGDRAFGGAREIDLAQLTPDPEQPRKFMNPERLAELAASIAAHGLLQPIVARQVGLDHNGDMRYVVLAGGRRYAAIKLALETVEDEATRARLVRVPIVINDSEAAERRVLQLIENLQREDLNGVEEARALKEIGRIEGLSTRGLAGRVYRSHGYVDERLRLLRHEDVEDAVETGLLNRSTGAAIASLPSADDRLEWLSRARRGEVVRAREVYGSKPKPQRRARRSVDPARADPALLADIARRAVELREGDPALTREESFHLAAVEARDAGDLDAGTVRRVLGAAARFFNPAARADPGEAGDAGEAYALPPLALLGGEWSPGDADALAAVPVLLQTLRAVRARVEGYEGPLDFPWREALVAELRAFLALVEEA